MIEEYNFKPNNCLIKIIKNIVENNDWYYTNRRVLKYKLDLIEMLLKNGGDNKILSNKDLLSRIIEKFRPNLNINKLHNGIIYLNFVLMFDNNIIKQAEKIKEEYNMNIILMEFDLQIEAMFHFINSDKQEQSNLCSRCIPKNPYEKWNKPHPDVYVDEDTKNEYKKWWNTFKPDVYIDDHTKNYIGCNISKIEIYYWIKQNIIKQLHQSQTRKIANNIHNENSIKNVKIYLSHPDNDLLQYLNITTGVRVNLKDITDSNFFNDIDSEESLVNKVNYLKKILKMLNKNIYKDQYKIVKNDLYM